METMIGRFLETLGRNSIEAGVLVVVVLLTQWSFGRKIAPQWRCALWLLVMARLLLPVSAGSVVSLFNLLPQMKTTEPAMAYRSVPPVTQQNLVPNTLTVPATEPVSHEAPPAVVHSPNAVTESPAVPLPTNARTESKPALAGAAPLKISEVSIVFAVWFAGFLLFTGYVLVSSFRIRQRFAKLKPIADPGVLALLQDCRERLGVRDELSLSESAEVGTPALYGFLRPRLLLPHGFARRFSTGELRFVLLHELAHVKRRDILFNWLAAILQIVHWFNPLIWFGFARWRADRELACDALALEAVGAGQNREYGQTILRLLENFSHQTAVPGLVGILENKKELQRRIRMIGSYRPGKKLGIFAAAVFIGLGVVCLTDAQLPKNHVRLAVRTNSNADLTQTNEVREVRHGADPLPVADATNLPAKALTITVIDAKTGQPIPGADVSAPNIGGWDKPQPRRLTDAQGHYVIEIPGPPVMARREMASFTIFASHPGYAERAISWTSSAGNVEWILPAKATIKLVHGITIGGVVRDAHHEPIAGVRVLLQGSGYSGFTIGAGEQKSQDYPEIYIDDKNHPAAVTDDNGRWTYSDFPKDLDTLNVTFIRPDESRYDYTTAPGDPGLNQFPGISPGDLRATNANIVLPDGITVRGIVVDEAGRPIAGAEVVEGYGHANIVRVSAFKTDAAGSFVRLNRAPRQWIYTASADGRATASVVAQVDAGMPEVRIVLPPADPLRIHATGEANHPLAGVDIRIQSYRTEGQLLDWKGTTDANGDVVWTNAPKESVMFDATTKSSGFREFEARAGEDKVVVLSKDSGIRATVNVSAYDATTRMPVKIQSVSAEYNGDFSFKSLVEPDATNASVEIKHTDFRVGMAPDYKIKVEADGYKPFVTDYIDLPEGDQNLVAAMVRGGSAEGTAYLPDGKPAADARIWVEQDDFAGPLFCNGPGRYYGDRMTKAAVDENGKFTLPAFDGNPPVIFTSPDGFLKTTLADIQKTREARLQPWGSIRGILKIAGQPKGGIRVNLGTLLWFPAIGFQLGYDTSTAPDGSFVFTNVPAGEYDLYQTPDMKPGPTTEDHQMPVTVEAGQATTVDYSDAGRAVIGQAASDKPGLAVDWLNDADTLTLKQQSVPALNYEDYASEKAFREAYDTSYQSPERLKEARDARTYVLQFDQDGSFRADDVPPGAYELKIQVTRPDPNDRFRQFDHPGNVLGSITKEVVVPPGDAPFDLGTLVVPMSEDGKRLAAANFSATTLDGKPISLAQFKGKYVLLAFWALWSERSTEELADFQKLQVKLSHDKRIAFLGASLDGDTDAVREAVRARGYRWTQTWLNPKNLAEATTAFDVSALPAIYLIDPEGHVIDRNLDGDRLGAAVNRVLARE